MVRRVVVSFVFGVDRCALFAFCVVVVLLLLVDSSIGVNDIINYIL